MGSSSGLSKVLVFLIAFLVVPGKRYFRASAQTADPTFLNECRVNISEGPVSSPTPITNCSASVDVNSSILLNYTLIKGNINGTFSIDSNGTVYQEAEVDREEIQFYYILVQAMTPDGRNGSTYLNITVDDVNDNYPKVSETNFTRNITLLDLEMKQTIFYQVQASDDDSGENAELNYSLEYFHYPIISPQLDLGGVVLLTINVSDMGNPQLSTTIQGRFNLGGPCLVQNHTINATTGRITSLLLCYVELVPTSVNLRPGDFVGLTCNYTSNIMHTMVMFIHKRSNFTALTNETTLNFTNVTMANAGPYICKVLTDIGEISSYKTYLDVAESHDITLFTNELVFREMSDARIPCFGSLLFFQEVQWIKRNFGELDGNKTIISSNTSDRINTTSGILTILDIESEDAGFYTCRDEEKSAVHHTVVIVYQDTDVVKLEILNYNNPSSTQQCHNTSEKSFQELFKNVTGLQPQIISQEGNNLCDEGVCVSSPCMNYGQCYPLYNETDSFECSCPPGYTGRLCEENVDECGYNGTCNDGQCKDTFGFFECICPKGFTGYNCQFRDVCNSTICPKGHTCINSMLEESGYFCFDSIWIDLSQLLQITLLCAFQSYEECTLDKHYLDILDDLVNFIRGSFNLTTPLSLNDTDGNMTFGNMTFCGEYGSECGDIFNVSECETTFVNHLISGKYGRSAEVPLIWNCPEGEIVPPFPLLDNICLELIKHQKVLGCSSPSGLSLQQNGSNFVLPNTAFNFSMILVNENMSVLNSTEAIAVLNSDEVKRMLLTIGFNVSTVYLGAPEDNNTTETTEYLATTNQSVTMEVNTTNSTTNPIAVPAKVDDSTTGGISAGVIGAIVSVLVVVSVGSVIAVLTIYMLAVYRKKSVRKMAYVAAPDIQMEPIIQVQPEQQGQAQEQPQAQDQSQNEKQ